MFEKTQSEEVEDAVINPLLEDLNTPEYIAKLHVLYDESSKGNKSSKTKFSKTLNSFRVSLLN